jgi:hypothetical protein
MKKAGILEALRSKFQSCSGKYHVDQGSKWISCGPHLFEGSRKIWHAERVISRPGHPDHVELRRMNGNVHERLILSVDALQSGSQLRPLRD